MSIISIKNISKTYFMGDIKINALQNISLNIEKGDFLAIVGSSGSGKSTLMNVLGCLDVAQSGKYFFNNKDIFSLSDKTLSKIRNEKIGFIFQSFNLIPSLTAFENVELPLIYRKIAKKERKIRVENALKKVGLQKRANHKPFEMSGGQQQRVAIARAIAGEPEVILADEPTGNLDSKTSNEVMKILQELNSCGISIILITHDMNIANLASKVISLNEGKIK